MSLLDNLPHKATAKKLCKSTDELGGPVDTYVTVFSDRDCWRQSVSSTEAMDAASRGVAISHKVYFNSDPGLNETHILVIDGDTHTVRSYSHPDASVGMSKLWRVFVDLELRGI